MKNETKNKKLIGVAIVLIAVIVPLIVCYIMKPKFNDINTTTSQSYSTYSNVVATDVMATVTTDMTTQTYLLPESGGSFKSYTDYRMLNKESPQWLEIQCHEYAYTDENGLRKITEYYCVAMGSYYTNTLGDLFEIQTENGSFKVVVCDFKADIHTDSNHRYTVHSSCAVEFYVDTDILNPKVKQMGDISYVEDQFSGEIISIIKIGNIHNQSEE